MATFCVAIVCVCMCSVHLVDLVKLSVLAKWLARKTPLTLRTPFCVKEISTKPRLKRAYDFRFSVLFYCAFVLSPALDNIFHTAVYAESAVKHQPINHGVIIKTLVFCSEQFR